jgi:hypothetical protein
MLDFLVVCNVPMTFQWQLPTSEQQDLGSTGCLCGEAEYESQRLTKAKKKMFGNEPDDLTLKGGKRCRTMTVLQEADSPHGHSRWIILVGTFTESPSSPSTRSLPLLAN